jgi:hypothetical protein
MWVCMHKHIHIHIHIHAKACMDPGISCIVIFDAQRMTGNRYLEPVGDKCMPRGVQCSAQDAQNFDLTRQTKWALRISDLNACMVWCTLSMYTHNAHLKQETSDH